MCNLKSPGCRYRSQTSSEKSNILYFVSTCRFCKSVTKSLFSLIVIVIFTFRIELCRPCSSLTKEINCEAPNWFPKDNLSEQEPSKATVWRIVSALVSADFQIVIFNLPTMLLKPDITVYSWPTITVSAW